MLELKNIRVTVNEKEIIHDLSATFVANTTTGILGQNGSGKSSLALAIAGHPRYALTGLLELNGVNMIPL